MTFDVIIVGARVAGSATGMLLARAGLRVLVVDRAHFPSDTLSTHQIQVPGVARLARFGLLEPLLDAGTPPTPHVRFQAGSAVIEAEFPTYDDVNMMISPRRTVLDTLLVGAARSAGAEVCEGCSLEALTVEDDQVTGVRLRDKRTGNLTIESAALVIGADGKHSTVAKLADAAEHRSMAAATFAFYAYWDGLPVKGGEIYSAMGYAVGTSTRGDRSRGAVVHDPWRRPSGGLQLPRLHYRRGSHAIVLQPSAPCSIGRRKGLSSARARPFAVNTVETGGLDLSGDRSGTGSEGAKRSFGFEQRHESDQGRGFACDG